MSIPEIDLMHYQRELDKAYAEEQWIQARSCELMEDEFNPENPEVFLDTLVHAGKDFIRELAPLLKTPRNTAEIGKLICSWVEDRLIEESEAAAANELDERKWQ